MTCMRTRFALSFGTLCAGALVLVACSGKLSLGGNGTTQSQEVAPSEVSGAVTACADGSAHPNVCCTAGPGQAASCLVYPDAPFTPCDSAATTYPDPRSCCPLDGAGACAPAASGSSTPGGGGSPTGGGGSTIGGCAYACPPGWYAPPGTSGDTCCESDSSGATVCTASGGASGCGGSCTCPACSFDSGACPPCACPPSPCPTPTSSCGACPPGWQTPQGDSGLCCTTDASGVIECFSQALPPGQPPEDGGSVVGPGPVGVGCGGSGSADGAAGACGCQEQANGHTYSVNCDPATNACTCAVDNGAPSASFPDNDNTCNDPTALFTSCGFPTN